MGRIVIDLVIRFSGFLQIRCRFFVIVGKGGIMDLRQIGEHGAVLTERGLQIPGSGFIYKDLGAAHIFLIHPVDE